LKRARALKKTKAEQELGRQKDKEIERLSQEIKQLRRVSSEQKGAISRYRIYQKFMEKVLDYSDEVRRYEVCV
jgi:molecular chaperone GrpE (heat shock protein)